MIKHSRAGLEDRLLENQPDLYVRFFDVVDHVWSKDADLSKWYNENVLLLLKQKGKAKEKKHKEKEIVVLNPIVVEKNGDLIPDATISDDKTDLRNEIKSIIFIDSSVKEEYFFVDEFHFYAF